MRARWRRFARDGYSQLDCHPKSLAEPELLKAVRDAYFIGIRSATQLTARVIENAPRLTGIGCFCIGTNQVDLKRRRIAGFRYSTRRSQIHAAWRNWCSARS